MYLSDVHTHSIASGHGTTCTVSDMAKAAAKKGLKASRHHRPRTWALLPLELLLISEVFLILPRSGLGLNCCLGLS